MKASWHHAGMHPFGWSIRFLSPRAIVMRYEINLRKQVYVIGILTTIYLIHSLSMFAMTANHVGFISDHFI